MNIIYRLTQTALPLVLAFVIGTYSTQTTQRAINEMNKPQGFTVEEARALLGKRVQNKCVWKGKDKPEYVQGEVVFLNKDWDGIRVTVDWDYTFIGRHSVIGYDKYGFNKCNEIIQPK